MTIPGLQVDLSSATPVYRQIADAIRAALLDGRLHAGDRLPPTRDLARQLGVNRNTVVASYDLLAARGLVRSRTGKGTFLVGVPSRKPLADEPGALQRHGGPGTWLTGFSRAVDGTAIGPLRSIYSVAIASEGISFAGTYPAAELMPVDGFREAMDRVLGEAGAEVLAYGPTLGFAPLRETIAADMGRKGSHLRADEILVTNGAQQAIDLVFRTLLDRGDTVVLEEPTYTGALSSLGSLGARMVGLPVDDEGIRPDLLALALDRHRPRLIYLQPTFQNPTTAAMGESRRREILALAERHRCVIVEDDWAGDLDFERRPRPTLHALDGGRRVVYLSTFSKKLLPGLRIGWAAGPTPVMQRLVELKQVQDFGTSPLVQAALHRFLVDGGLDGHLERVLPAYRERRDAMLSALERHFPAEARWTRPEGGLFVWVVLPSGMNANELFLSARRQGVLFSRGELFHSGATGRETMRLAYGGASPGQIEEGIAKLGKLVRERWSERSAETPAVAAETVPIL